MNNSTIYVLYQDSTPSGGLKNFDGNFISSFYLYTGRHVEIEHNLIFWDQPYVPERTLAQFKFKKDSNE